MSANRFCGIMNMPPPPKPKAYSMHNRALLKAAKAVANQTITDEQIKIHDLKGEDLNAFSNCGDGQDDRQTSKLLFPSGAMQATYQK